MQRVDLELAGQRLLGLDLQLEFRGAGPQKLDQSDPVVVREPEGHWIRTKLAVATDCKSGRQNQRFGTGEGLIRAPVAGLGSLG